MVNDIIHGTISFAILEFLHFGIYAGTWISENLILSITKSTSTNIRMGIGRIYGRIQAVQGLVFSGIFATLFLSEAFFWYVYVSFIVVVAVIFFDSFRIAKRLR